MRAMVQRVGGAKVLVAGDVVGEISGGMLVYLGVGSVDDESVVNKIVQKIIHLRIFPDDVGKMNRSLIESGGEMLVVSQFTLYADVRKGRRPSFADAAPPDIGDRLYKRFIESVASHGIRVATGIFQAHMHVSSINDGPVTIYIDSDTLPS